MRVGFNPNKDKKVPESSFFHQVVIPVYIPNLDGYFKDSLTILKYCLESLFRTCHDKTYISVVNNGSCLEVVNYLNKLYEENKIQELINTTNIGYINAMLKGVAGQNFTFFTTADADVLFLNGWQEETYKIFETIPKTGVVSPSPSPKVLKFLTSNILFEKGFSTKMKFTHNKVPDAMLSFVNSIGAKDSLKEVHLKKCLTFQSKSVRAIVGSGHFVVTYRSDIFDALNKRYTPYALGGDSDYIFDLPVVKKGYWRLSTEANYAYHMGNVMEKWIEEKFSDVKEVNNYYDCPKLIKFKNNRFENWLKTVFFVKIIYRKPIWRLFLQWKGLTKEEAKEY